MFLMAVCRTKAAVLIFPATAGVMYATQFTLPYILIVHYHNTNMLEPDSDWSKRGLGTDVALVTSMTFPAQILLALCTGPLVRLSNGSPTIIMYAASAVGACGAFTATKVTYHGI